MLRLILIAALFASQALAADDPQQTIAALQAELQATREQREEAHNRTAAIIAQANQRIAALQKRIDELSKPEAKVEKK